jgi:hypothetical protein
MLWGYDLIDVQDQCIKSKKRSEKLEMTVKVSDVSSFHGDFQSNKTYHFYKTRVIIKRYKNDFIYKFSEVPYNKFIINIQL